jgi:hypothetical protein
VQQGCQIFLGPNIPKWENICTKWPQTIPNGHKLYQMIKNIPNGHKIWQHIPLRGPPTFSRIVIFGLKINHLATPACSGVEKNSWHLILIRS